MYVLIGIVFIIVGLANLKFPEAACYINEEWQFKGYSSDEKRKRLVKVLGTGLVIFGGGTIVYGFISLCL